MKKALNESQENGLTIKIQEPKKNFIILYDSVYKNTNLTSDEIALIVKLLSCAPTFKPTKEKLISLLHISDYAFKKASKGLQDKGYLKVKKYGKNSEWTISQEPLNSQLKDFNKETLLNALLKYQITIEQLNQLHKLKYIDDKLYIETTQDYTKELIRIAKYNVYEDNE